MLSDGPEDQFAYSSKDTIIDKLKHPKHKLYIVHDPCTIRIYAIRVPTNAHKYIYINSQYSVQQNALYCSQIFYITISRWTLLHVSITCRIIIRELMMILQVCNIVHFVGLIVGNWLLTMHGMNNIERISAKQAKEIYQYNSLMMIPQEIETCMSVQREIVI
jgi:hypothetical protein